jgi:hypothetical protein
MGDVTGINEQPERRPITMRADSRPVSRRLEEIVVAARALAGDLAGGAPGQEEGDGDLLGDAATRLRRSVIGPLERASALPHAGTEAGTERASTGRGDGEPARSPRECLWDLAREATVLRTEPGATNELLEPLREEQRARWVELLSRSADDALLPADPEWRAAFVAYLEWGSRFGLENSQPGAHPPPHMPVPRHATSALLETRLSDGRLFVEGKTWTGFANSEERFADEFVGQKIQPFWIEDEATRVDNTNFIVASRFKSHAVRDGLLITGQQQYSGAAAACLMIQALGQ